MRDSNNEEGPMENNMNTDGLLAINNDAGRNRPLQLIMLIEDFKVGRGLLRQWPHLRLLRF